jgi:hypothetical protein
MKAGFALKYPPIGKNYGVFAFVLMVRRKWWRRENIYRFQFPKPGKNAMMPRNYGMTANNRYVKRSLSSVVPGMKVTTLLRVLRAVGSRTKHMRCHV